MSSIKPKMTWKGYYSGNSSTLKKTQTSCYVDTVISQKKRRQNLNQAAVIGGKSNVASLVELNGKNRTIMVGSKPPAASR